MFLLDEAWLFIKNETIRNYVVQAQKTWRKHKAAMILATQSIKFGSTSKGQAAPERKLRRSRAGGPVIRGHTFYYVASEQEGAHGDDSSLISPSVANAINGVLGSGAFPRIATRTVNPALFRTARAETELSGRLDHQMRNKQSLLLKYALTNNREAGDAFNTGGAVDPSGRGSSFTEDQGGTGSLTSIVSNNALNSVRFQLSTRRAVLRTTDKIGPEISIAGLIDFWSPLRRK